MRFNRQFIQMVSLVFLFAIVLASCSGPDPIDTFTNQIMTSESDKYRPDNNQVIVNENTESVPSEDSQVSENIRNEMVFTDDFSTDTSRWFGAGYQEKEYFEIDQQLGNPAPSMRLLDGFSGTHSQYFEFSLITNSEISFDARGEFVASLIGNFSIPGADMYAGGHKDTWPLAHATQINDFSGLDTPRQLPMDLSVFHNFRFVFVDSHFDFYLDNVFICSVNNENPEYFKTAPKKLEFRGSGYIDNVAFFGGVSSNGIPEPAIPMENTQPEVSLPTEHTEICPPSNLQVGNFVRVVDVGRVGILRSSPDLTVGTDNITLYLTSLDVLQITAGPICSLAENMWMVERSDGNSGWVQEYDGNTILLEYVPPPKAVEEELPPENPDSSQPNKPFADCPVTYLQVGNNVYVAYGGGANNLRSSAVVSSSANNIIRQIPEGGGMFIIDGPACSNGYLLWEVETDSGEVGWTAETNGGDYWLIPY